MKLLQCKIENFGKLSDVSFDFSEGVNTFCEENGWGKSTLANFVRIMFFGFLNGNKQDKLVNERKRYFPWQSTKGVYGGSVKFETEGKSYQLNRVFGKKDKDDIFELYDLSTNLPCEDFSENIGVELFGIDAASFGRTVFFSQKDCESAPTDGIHAKLGNLIEQTDDIHNFQSVYDKLKDTTNKMTPKRKTGSLNREKREIEEREQKLREEESIRQGILEAETYYKQCEEKEKELSEVIAAEQKKQEKLSKAMDYAVNRKEYETLVSAKEQAGKQWEDSKNAFPYEDKIPSMEQMGKWQKQRRECEQFREQMVRNQLTGEENALVSSVKQRFGQEIPEDAALQSMEEALTEYESLKQTIRKGEFTPAEQNEWETLKKRYPNGMPGKEELLKLNRICEDVRHKEDQLANAQTTARALKQVAAQKKPERSKRRKNSAKNRRVVLGAIAVLVVVYVGTSIYFMHHFYPQTTLNGRNVGGYLAAFVVLALVAVVLFVLQKGKKQEEDLSEQPLLELEQEMERTKREIEQGNEKISFVLSAYFPEGISGDFRDVIQQMQMDTIAYETHQAKSEAVSEEDEVRYQTLQKSLREFMDGYVEMGISEERFAFGLSKLRSELKQYRRLCEKLESFLGAKKKYEQAKEEFVLGGKEYGLIFEEPFDEELQKIAGAINRVQVAEQSWQAAGKKLLQFENDHDMERIRETKEAGENEGLSESHEREKRWMTEQENNRKNMAAYEKQLEQLEEKLDELAEIRLELEERKEHFASGNKKYELLLKTMDKLQQAKDTLTARYIEPVQKGFTKYYQMVDGGDAKDYRFDAGVNLTVEEMGMPREIRFLSEGRKDLAGICARMAMVDAMYEKDKPFLVFDDSFVNLDDEKMRHALTFLKEVGKEYQVIYFTCRENRKA